MEGKVDIDEQNEGEVRKLSSCLVGKTKKAKEYMLGK